MTNKVWLGVTSPKEFIIPENVNDRKNTYVREDGTIMAKFGNVCWFTNLDLQKRHEEMILVRHYNPNDYPHYTNYDAIEVSKVSDIPCDYSGIMGVPITFFLNYNPEQFEIVGRSHDIDWAEKECSFYTAPSDELKEAYKRHDRTWRMQIPYWLDNNGMPAKVYLRIFIKNKHPEVY